MLPFFGLYTFNESALGSKNLVLIIESIIKIHTTATNKDGNKELEERCLVVQMWTRM